MTRLHAQPYDMDASGFYFETAEEYKKLADANKNAFGQPVEEYEIQFIDGERIDCELAKALGLNQVNLARFFEVVNEWEDHDKVRFIIANGECGYSFDLAHFDPDSADIDEYQVESLRELAEMFVEDGLFGDVPKAFENYIDYDAIARDLSIDYGTCEIAGTRYAYRCG